MPHTGLHNEQPRGEAASARIYSPALQPLLQSLLATLADIDFEFEREREKLTDNTPDVNLKIRILEKLKAQHRERREPYIQQLAVLQERMLRINS